MWSTLATVHRDRPRTESPCPSHATVTNATSAPPRSCSLDSGVAMVCSDSGTVAVVVVGGSVGLEQEEGDSSTVLHDTIVKFAERGVVGLVYRFGRLLWNEVGEGVVVLREEFSRRRGRRGRRRMR